MSESIRKRKDPDRRAFVRRMILLALSAVLVLALALFEYFLPFRTLLPAYSVPMRAEGELRLHFLSVGQGDACIVEFPDDACLVIDAGDGSFENDNKIYRYLKALAPRSLSVAVTHADSDHCGGVGAILQRFAVDELRLPAIGSAGTFYSEFVSRAEEREIPVDTLARYDVIANASGAYLVCISPRSVGETDSNDASAVLYLRYGETSALFGADISSVRERLLLRENQLGAEIFSAEGYAVALDDVDILKVSHHGSGSSSCSEWLELIRPEVAVVSCGAGNAYGHPAAEALSRLSQYAEIYRTDELGDIVVSVFPEGYTIQP